MTDKKLVEVRFFVPDFIRDALWRLKYVYGVPSINQFCRLLVVDYVRNNPPPSFVELSAKYNGTFPRFRDIEPKPIPKMHTPDFIYPKPRQLVDYEHMNRDDIINFDELPKDDLVDYSEGQASNKPEQAQGIQKPVTPQTKRDSSLLSRDEFFRLKKAGLL